ncbi:MAG: pyridoxal-phosphate dependent enzyme, partial [Bacteroidales bacterium]|nr:pyridoxal-phosphate dependent enzyme [Bacteroidales bacterium]
AFKFRGACNAVFSLSDQQAIHGVCTHSSGNHAQALALAARIRGIKAYIVMPENAPRVKVEAVKGYGGIITFCEPTLEARETTLLKVIQDTGAIEIHPYNNYYIISGQATSCMELLDEIQGLDIVVAPVGGGGLLSGTALAANYFSPGTKVIAAEPLNANDAWQGFKQKKWIPQTNPQTIADGLRTSLGMKNFEIIQKYVHDILTVDEPTIVKAMRLIWERMKIIVEPSSAVPLGAILSHPETFKDKKTGIIISGGNIDLSQLPW